MDKRQSSAIYELRLLRSACTTQPWVKHACHCGLCNSVWARVRAGAQEHTLQKCVCHKQQQQHCVTRSLVLEIYISTTSIHLTFI